MTQLDRITRALAPQPTAPAAESPDERLDPLGLWRSLRRQFWFILLVTAALLAVAVPQILQLERTYSSTARILIRESESPMTGDTIVPDAQRDVGTEMERLTSRRTTAVVIDELGLRDSDEINPALRETTLKERLAQYARSLLTAAQGAELATRDPLDRIIPQYLMRLTIWRSAAASVVNIGFTSRDPELSAAVPNTIIRTYLDQRAEDLAARVRSAEAWFDGRLSEQRARVAEAEEATRAAQRSAETASPEALGGPASVSALSDRRAEIARSRAGIGAELRALQSNDTAGADESLVETERLHELREELAIERATLAQLRERYGEMHLEVVAHRNRVAYLELAARDEVARHELKLRTELDALLAEQALIDERLDALRESLLQVKNAEADVATLIRRVNSERQALQDIESERRSFLASAALPKAVVEILSPASVPQQPDGRGRSFYLLVALVVAGVLGVTAGFARDIFDNTLRRVDELPPLSKVTPAGALPAFRRKTGRELAAGQVGGLDPALREAARKLVLALRDPRSGDFPQSLLVTSVRAGDGKTVVASLVALELAAIGRDVVLIEGAGRKAVAAGRELGFADYLAERRALDEVTSHDPRTGVCVIAAGTGGGWYVDRGRVDELVRTLNARGAVVIFDGQGPASALETLQLAPCVQRTLLVTRWGRTDKAEAAKALHRLLAAGSEDIRVVLNTVMPGRQRLYGAGDADLDLRRRTA